MRYARHPKLVNEIESRSFSAVLVVFRFVFAFVAYMFICIIGCCPSYFCVYCDPITKTCWPWHLSVLFMQSMGRVLAALRKVCDMKIG